MDNETKDFMIMISEEKLRQIIREELQRLPKEELLCGHTTNECLHCQKPSCVYD